MRTRAFLLCFLAFLAFSTPGLSQDSPETALHVLRPVLRAEKDKAELCLEFDHTLDPSIDQALSGVRLESKKKSIPLTPQTVSLTADFLCLSSLDHRRNYRLTLSNLRGENGEKLDGPYSLAFTIPDRPAALAFAGNAGDLMPWKESDPILRGINVERVRIGLYQIVDPSLMARAWRESRQTTLAPAESAAFAKEHGRLVWKGDLVLGDNPNRNSEHKIPLSILLGDTPSGLYLITAQAHADDDEDFLPTASAWLLRSNLKINAVRDPQSLYALTENTNAPGITSGVRLLLQSQNGHILSEAQSDSDGISQFRFPVNNADEADLIVGLTNAGDVAFADLTSGNIHRLALSGNQAALTMDKAFYEPGSTAYLTLTAKDVRGEKQTIPDSVLRILRPDRSFYQSIPIPVGLDAAPLPLPVPGVNGVWPVLWERSDGTRLAENSLHITTNPEAPSLEIRAERLILPASGDIQLTLKSLNKSGGAYPYVSGQIFVTWTVPERIFSGWDHYIFGTGEKPTSEASHLGTFLTNGQGLANLHVQISPPKNFSSLRSAILTIQSDPSSGVADPPPLILPMKPEDYIVGIKPMAAQGRFAENSTARFEIIALDSEGERRKVDHLTYQIYEEGRSFEWHQTEGRWDYKPQQQKRRIGGGVISIKDDGPSILEWPVTSGTYRLEIIGHTKTVLAATRFNAGWMQVGPEPLNETPLSVSLSSPSLQEGQPVPVRIELDRSATVRIFIGDDRIRKIFHMAKPPGVHEISFIPEADWGRVLNVRVEAADRVAKLALPRKNKKEDEVFAHINMDTPLTIEPRIPSFLRAGDAILSFLNLNYTGKKPQNYRYKLRTLPNLKPADSNSSLTFIPQQTKNIPFTLKALYPGEGTIQFDITDGHTPLNKTWAIPILSERTVIKSTALAPLAPQQIWPGPLAKKAREKTGGGFILMGIRPLYNAPSFLASLISAPVITTQDIALALETMRLWQNIIIDSGLESRTALEARQKDLLFHLLARQSPEGGFAPLPKGKEDIATTAAALSALAKSNQLFVQPALDLASNWLKRRLENAWFEEQERSERAAAYPALADAGRLDASNLHYFADTSKDKALAPVAALQLSLALARSGDMDKAGFWLEKSGVLKDLSGISTDGLLLLAENPAYDSNKLLPALDKLSDAVPNRTGTVTIFLQSLYKFHERAGDWHVTLETDKRNPRSILAVPLHAVSGIHNTGSSSLFMVQGNVENPDSRTDITRHIYKPNGDTVSPANLRYGETYLILLHGNWPDNAKNLLVHEYSASGLRPIGCVPAGFLDTDETLGWLKNNMFSESVFCDLGKSVNIMLTRKDTDPSWRTAYFAKAERRGLFTLPGTGAYDPEKGSFKSGPKERVEIR